MITNDDGVKVSAKVKVKLLLKEYLDGFELSEEGDWSKGDVVRIEDQIVKIKERLNKSLVVKTEEGA